MQAGRAFACMRPRNGDALRQHPFFILFFLIRDARDLGAAPYSRWFFSAICSHNTTSYWREKGCKTMSVHATSMLLTARCTWLVVCHTDYVSKQDHPPRNMADSIHLVHCTCPVAVQCSCKPQLCNRATVHGLPRVRMWPHSSTCLPPAFHPALHPASTEHSI